MNFQKWRILILLFIVYCMFGTTVKYQIATEMMYKHDQVPKRFNIENYTENSKTITKSINEVTTTHSNFLRWNKTFSGGCDSFEIGPDLNNDGTADLITTIANQAYLIEGDAGTVLLNRTIGVDDFNKIANPSNIDKDNDGIEDILCANTTHCFLLNGANGSILWDIPLNHSLTPGLLWIGDDFNGDGQNETLFGTWKYNVTNYLYCIDVVKKQILWKLDWYSGFLEEIGIPRRLQDLNNDTFAEIIISTLNRTIICIDGLKGVIIWKFSLLDPQKIGDYDIIVDSNGDGVDEVIIGYCTGEVICLDGAIGQQLGSSWISSIEDDYRIIQVCTLDSLTHKIVVGTNNGYVYLLRWDGIELNFEREWDELIGERIIIIQIIRNLFPFTGDKFDLIIGSDKFIHALDGNGSILWFEVLSPFSPQSIITVADLTGDGRSDVFIEAHYASTTQISLYDALGPYNLSNESVKESLSLFGYKDSFLHSVSLFDDVDSDNIDEILVSSESGKVTLLNGSNFNPIWQKEFDECITIQKFEDLNYDNVSEIISYSPTALNPVIRCLTGNNATPRWSLDASTVLNMSEIYELVPYRDINGDGITDILIFGKGLGVSNRTYCISGNSSKLEVESAILWKGIIPENQIYRSYRSSIVCDEHLYPQIAPLIIGGETGLYGFDPSLNSSAPLWVYPTDGSILAIELVQDISGDLIPEIVFGGHDYKISCIIGEYSTSPDREWYIDSPSQGVPSEGAIRTLQSITDVNQDKIDDLLVGTYSNASAASAFCLNVGNKGQILWSFVPGANVKSLLALNDINDDHEPDALIGTGKGKLFCIEGDANETEILTKYLWCFKRTGIIEQLLLISDLTNDGINEILVKFDQHPYVYAIDPTTNYEHYPDNLPPYIEIDLEVDSGYQLQDDLLVGYNTCRFIFTGNVSDKSAIGLIQAYISQNGLIFANNAISHELNNTIHFIDHLTSQTNMSGGLYSFVFEAHDIHGNIGKVNRTIGIDSLFASIETQPQQERQQISVGEVKVFSTIRGVLTEKDLNVYTYELKKNATSDTVQRGNLTFESNTALLPFNLELKNVTEGLYYLQYKFADKITPLSITINSDRFYITKVDGELPIDTIIFLLLGMGVIVGGLVGYPAYTYRKRILKTQPPGQDQMSKFLDDISQAIEEGKGKTLFSRIRSKIKQIRKKEI